MSLDEWELKFIESLNSSIKNYDSKDFDAAVSAFDSLDELMPDCHGLRGVPMNFFEAWVDQIKFDFYGGYEGISEPEWRELAVKVVLSVENSSVDYPALVIEHFTPKEEKKPSHVLGQKTILFFYGVNILCLIPSGLLALFLFEALGGRRLLASAVGLLLIPIIAPIAGLFSLRLLRRSKGERWILAVLFSTISFAVVLWALAVGLIWFVGPLVHQD